MCGVFAACFAVFDYGISNRFCYFDVRTVSSGAVVSACLYVTCQLLLWPVENNLGLF